MATWSMINCNAILADRRNDAEFYKAEYLSSVASVKRFGSNKLRKLGAEVVSGPFGSTLKSSEYTSSGIPLIRISDLEGFFINKDDLVYISDSAHQKIKGSEVKEGDLVLSKVGNSIGIVSMLDDEITKANISENNIGIRFKNNICAKLKSYILVYLNSSFGQSEILRRRSGNAQPKLNISDVYQIEVPLFSDAEQELLHNLVMEIERALKHSKLLYCEAQHLLESELGLDKLKFKKPVGYTARFSTVELSDAFHAGRIDAQCFAPNAIFYENWLRNHAQCDRLNQLLEAKIKGRQQEEAERGSIDYCSIKHISGHELTDVSKCQPSPDTPLAIKDNLLLAITGATIGKIGIIKRYKQLAFSGDLLCLKASPEIDPHYLLVALDHIIGQVQFNRWITGSTNGHLAPRDVGRLLVPRLRKSIESRIAELVEESLRKRVESEKLLIQAKTRVEQLIEEVAKS